MFFYGTKIAVNGKVVSLTDSKGKAIQPLEYNGFTYLPITKGLSDSLQLATKLDSKKQKLDIQIPYVTNSFKVYSDEKPIDLKDKDGNKINPFIYNGSVYVKKQGFL